MNYVKNYVKKFLESTKTYLWSYPLDKALTFSFKNSIV